MGIVTVTVDGKVAGVTFNVYICSPPTDELKLLIVSPLTHISLDVNPATGRLEPPRLKVTLTGTGLAFAY